MRTSLPPSPLEVIEPTLRSQREIDRRSDAGGEIQRRAAGREVVVRDPSGAEIGEEVVAGVLVRKLRREKRIERAAGDGAAASRGLRVRIERRRESRIACRTFRQRPAIVGAGDALVDLLPGVLPDVVDQHASTAGFERERKRIAQPERPDRAIDPARRRRRTDCWRE